MPELPEGFILEDDPFWYKDAIIYELHVRAFFDSNDDGIGDFAGLTQKLDYLQDLGVTAIWLLPFYPSPLKDDGYDIADYTNVHPSYGTLPDFKTFLREAHRRGLRVISELVLNHTSDQHAWFQRSRRAKPGSPARDFYVWSDTADRYKDARIIFKDFETSNWTWDPVANQYYWHRFYHHQPDLNFESPDVIRSLLSVVKFWMGMGVDGMRLDAVPYLYERDGTNCENLPETHVFLKQLRKQIDDRFRNRMLLAEANQWPEDAVAYFGNADECQMCFHFPVMPRMFMALRMEDRFPIIDILAQTPALPESCQWALFLRNHDELTLEMVTDEERDYMYRAYAHDPQMRINVGIRRRLASLLGKDWNRIELMNALLFSLPGTPVLYYGDEIGMGDNIYLGDRNSVRTPMQWSPDRNAGFSKASPHRLFLPIVIDPDSHYEAFNVEAQQNNQYSMLWWMKRLIAMRKRYKAFGRGTLEFLYPENHRVLAFIRRYQDEVILVIANLSRFVQYAGLDLAAFKGTSPIELFGRAQFPPIGDSPYFLTLGPHSFYWFLLTPVGAVYPSGFALSRLRFADRQGGHRVPLQVTVQGHWTNVLSGRARVSLEDELIPYLQTQRWFGGKARQIKAVRFNETVPFSFNSTEATITQIQVEYTEEDPEIYILPLSFATGERAAQIFESSSNAVLAKVTVRDKDGETAGCIYDAILDKEFCKTLVQMIARRKHLRGAGGDFIASPTRAMRNGRLGTVTNLEVSSLRAEQSNSSIVFGDELILKLFRRTEPGINPDIEIGYFLTERVGFPHAPSVAGTIEYRTKKGETAAVGILQKYVPNEGDAWQHTLDALSQYFDRAVTRQADELKDLLKPIAFVDRLQHTEIPPLGSELIGPYFENVKLLGQRTAELHVVLASNMDDADFVPEPFSVLYQRSLYQSMRNHSGQMFQLLKSNLKSLRGVVLDEALKVLDQQNEVLDRFQSLLSRKITAKRTRIHGDFHLGQVLYTGKDYVIIDFEGEPTRPLTERRIKRSPIRDVAGMLRSFHYAAYTSLFGHLGSAMVRPEDLTAMEPWARLWNVWISSTFLNSYLQHAGPGGFLPTNRDELNILLNVYLFEKALYELGYELNNRPDWVRIPLTGILQLLQAPEAAA
jgi:maltose alpha-D-glucosyltransferase/alpha-amylase